jgi:hypothetical protein
MLKPNERLLAVALMCANGAVREGALRPRLTFPSGGGKVREIVCRDLFNIASILGKLPGLNIQPLDGVRSKLGWYNAVYAVFEPVYSLVRLVAGRYVTDTAIFEPADINRLGAISGKS